MATNQTTNYQLNQWEPTDAVQRVEFNQDNAKVDTALKSLSDQVIQKANQSALNTLISSVNQKADAATVSALSQAVDGHTAQLAQKGNCQVHVFTYTGTGTYGNSGPTYVYFSKSPVFFIIMGGDYFALGSRQMSRVLLDLSQNNSDATASWSGNRLAFSAGAAAWQLNQSGTTYTVVALYANDGT